MSEQRTLDSIRVDTPAPPHVPKDRIVDLCFATGGLPNDLVDPGSDIPGLLFNAAHGGMDLPGRGSWVVTHCDDIDRVYTDNEYFSNKGANQCTQPMNEQRGGIKYEC
jgi:hypothetical protein